MADGDRQFWNCSGGARTGKGITCLKDDYDYEDYGRCHLLNGLPMDEQLLIVTLLILSVATVLLPIRLFVDPIQSNRRLQHDRL